MNKYQFWPESGLGFLQSGRPLLWFEGDEYMASLVAEDPGVDDVR